MLQPRIVVDSCEQSQNKNQFIISEKTDRRSFKTIAINSMMFEQIKQHLNFSKIKSNQVNQMESLNSRQRQQKCRRTTGKSIEWSSSVYCLTSYILIAVILFGGTLCSANIGKCFFSLLFLHSIHSLWIEREKFFTNRNTRSVYKTNRLTMKLTESANENMIKNSYWIIVV